MIAYRSRPRRRKRRAAPTAKRPTDSSAESSNPELAGFEPPSSPTEDTLQSLNSRPFAPTAEDEPPSAEPVCVLSSAVYEVAGSIGCDPSAMTTHRIPIDTCSGYNLIARAHLPAGWDAHIVRNAPKPRLFAADRSPLRLVCAVRLLTRLGNNVYRLPFYVAEELAVPLLLGTAFTDSHVSAIEPLDRRIRFRYGGSLPLLSNTASTDAPEECVSPRPALPPLPKKHAREVDPSDGDIRTIRLAKAIRIPAMTQIGATATTDATGLVFLEPKPTLFARHEYA